MKILVTEFILERFTVEIPDNTPQEDLNAAVEKARVAYEGLRDVSLSDTNWEMTATTHKEIADLLIRYRPVATDFPGWLSNHDRECWKMYLNDYLPAGGLHLNYHLWLAGNEYHNPRHVARVLDEQEEG